MRYRACKELGYTDIPVKIIPETATVEQLKAYTIKDNNGFGEWDFDLLANDWDFSELEEWGVDLPNMDLESDEKEIVEDSAPEVDEQNEPITKKGDIFQLGRHRLMCGDSTSVDDVEKLMNGAKADLVFTDPPYGIDVVQGDKIGGDKPFGSVVGNNIIKANKYMAIKGDETTDTARLNFEIVKELSENQIIFGGNYFTDFLPTKSCWIVWDKENTGNFADVELAWTSFDKGAKLYKWLWNGLCRKGDRKTEGKTRVHPTQKPVGLIADILKDFSKENDNIFDGFGGSGSTLMACEQTNRTCYMIEYEPHYVDVIIARWEKFTGQKAVLLN